jgi:hypothetical protein
MDSTSQSDYWHDMRCHGRLVLISSVAAQLAFILLGVHHPITSNIVSFFNLLGLVMISATTWDTSGSKSTAATAAALGAGALVASVALRWFSHESGALGMTAELLSTAAVACVAVTAMIWLEGRRFSACQSEEPHHLTA